MDVCIEKCSEAWLTRIMEGACGSTRVLSFEGGGSENTLRGACFMTRSEAVPHAS